MSASVRLDIRSGSIVAAGLAVWVAMLWPLHDSLPMWVEGLPAYMDQLMAMVGAPCTPPTNTVAIGGVALPMAIDAYQGPLNTYLDVPVARRWLDGTSSDLYAYRYKGIVLLGLSSLLLFGLLRRIAPAAIAILATFVFATLPINAVTAIGDLQFHVALYLGVLGILYAEVRYAESRRPGWLFAAAFFAGFALWTRAEALLWTAAAGIVYALVSGRSAIRNWWQATSGKALLACGCLVAFLIGAAPIVLFNVMNPRNGLVGFLLEGSAASAVQGQLIETLVARGRQFVDFILLNRWGLYEVRTAHWVLAVAFALCAALVIGSWLRERKITFPLLAAGVVLLLSVLAHRGPREIHLLPLTLAVVAVLAEGASRLRQPAGAWLIAAILASNLIVNAIVLSAWEETRKKADTLLTHSCPECLATRLQTYVPDGAFRFTNIGLYHEALWGSRGRVCGSDILHWGDEPGFRNAVRNALETEGVKVFVAFSAARERAIPGRALPRTDMLRDEIGSSGVSYRIEQVADASGRALYELYVVTSQAPFGPNLAAGGVNPPANSIITGWITGTGFRSSDRLVIDGHSRPTTFGGPGLLTFAVPEEWIADRRTLNVQLRRGEETHPGRPIVLQRP